jgi:enoyl-CoA hydratase/carnithine racemase
MSSPTTSATPIRQERHGGVALITLDDPARRNVLSQSLLDALGSSMIALALDRDLRCVVITGAGSVFASGANLRDVRGNSPAENLTYNREILQAFRTIETMPVPTIAALNGHALGGGLELALACTLRVSSATAKLGLPEVRLGLVPGAGGCQRLPRIVPPGTARMMLLSGQVVEGRKAHDIGLVDMVAETPEDAVSTAMSLAQEIASNAPLSVRAIVEVLRISADHPIGVGIEATQEVLRGLLSSNDLAEGIEAFLERRPARFQGR